MTLPTVRAVREAIDVHGLVIIFVWMTSHAARDFRDAAETVDGDYRR